MKAVETSMPVILASALAILCASSAQFLLPVSAAHAQAKPWADIVAAAGQEGEVVFYAVDLQDRVKAMSEAFALKYPNIKITFHRGNSVEMNTRMAAEEQANAPTADVFASAEPALMALWSKEGKLTPLDGPNYAELKETVFKQHPALAPGQDRVVYSGVAYEIVWNTELVKEPIKDYKDLVDRAAEFGEGRLAAVNWLGPSSGLFYTQVEERTSGVDLANDPTAGTWLQQFAALKPKLYNSGSPVAQSVASGEAVAGIYAPTPAILPLKGKGAPLAHLIVKSVPTSNNFMLGIVGRGAHPNAGQVLVDFLLSPEGQAAAATGGAIVVRSGVEGSSGGPELFNVAREAVLDSGFLDTYRARWQSVMGQ